MEQRQKPQWDQGKKQGGFSKPMKSKVAAPIKGPIQLITNNFKIKSKNHGIIYTYRVDFIEGSPEVTGGNRGGGDKSSNYEEEEIKTSFTKLSLGGGGNGLETFQKFKIMNAHATQLKAIFMQYVFVGNNLFSTS